MLLPPDSLLMAGPSPALAPALVTRGAARGAISVGLLAFQGGVAGMGTGADDMVASAHAMSIGVGEVIGPMIGGFVVDLLPTSPAFACEPNVPIVQLHDPIFQLAGEIRPHLSSSSRSSSSSGGGGGGGGGEQGQQELSEDAEAVYSPAISSADIAADARQGEDLGSAETKQGEDVVWVTRQEENNKSRLLTLHDGEGHGQGQGRAEEEDWITVEFRQGGPSTGRLLGEDSHEDDGVSRMLLAEEEEEEKEEKRARGKLRQGQPDDSSSTRSAFKPAEAAERRRDAGGRDGERKLGQQQQQQRRERRALLERGRGRRARRGRHRIRSKRENDAAAAAAAVTSSKGGEEEEDPHGMVAVAAAAAAGLDGAGGLGGSRGGAGLPIEMGSGENDVEYLPVVGQALTGAGAAAAAAAAQSVGAVDGLGDGGGAGSCDSAFPLATTLLAWASGFAVLAMYRLLPSPAGGVGGVGGGVGGKAAHGVVVLPA
ncbi:unnamed protein product [Ectocarpus sp. CCAP 1310/34]|nr:unnamed protein product [Ectocarpus sp. CCAP 1310/34]